MTEGIDPEAGLATLKANAKYLRTFEYTSVLALSVLTLFAVPPIRNQIIGNNQGFFFSGGTETEQLADEIIESFFIFVTMAFICLIQYFIHMNHAKQKEIEDTLLEVKFSSLQKELTELKKEINQLKTPATTHAA